MIPPDHVACGGSFPTLASSEPVSRALRSNCVLRRHHRTDIVRSVQRSFSDAAGSRQPGGPGEQCGAYQLGGATRRPSGPGRCPGSTGAPVASRRTRRPPLSALTAAPRLMGGPVVRVLDSGPSSMTPTWSARPRRRTGAGISSLVVGACPSNSSPALVPPSSAHGHARPAPASLCWCRTGQRWPYAPAEAPRQCRPSLPPCGSRPAGRARSHWPPPSIAQRDAVGNDSESQPDAPRSPLSWLQAAATPGDRAKEEF